PRRSVLAARSPLAAPGPARRVLAPVGAALSPRAGGALRRARLAAPASPARRRQDARGVLLLRRRRARLLLPVGFRSRSRPLQPGRGLDGARRRGRAVGGRARLR